MSADMTPPSLWPQPIPIIGGTGEHGSGKSRFGLSICPGPQTLMYDFEQSAASYTYIGFERIDVQKEMHRRFPTGYKPVDLFLWWLDHVRQQPADKYRVIMVDPVTDLERGLTDYVAANPEKFGHTHAQYTKMSGIMWGDIKDFEKMVLADVTARCETFYFTAHVGREFEGNSATGKLKAKGKSTLNELASLYLWFARKANAKGEKAGPPVAKVLKSRLEVGAIMDGEVVSYAVLPPQLPVATPKAIREYFATPAGGKVLADSERHVEEVMTDEERLRLELARAEADRDASMAKLALSGKTAEAGRPTSGVAAVGEAAGAPAPTSEQHRDNFAAGIDAAISPEALTKLGQDIRDAKAKGWITPDHAKELEPKFLARKKELADVAATKS